MISLLQKWEKYFGYADLKHFPKGKRYFIALCSDVANLISKNYHWYRFIENEYTFQLHWTRVDLHAGGLDFRLFDGSDLKTYLLMRR